VGTDLTIGEKELARLCRDGAYMEIQQVFSSLNNYSGALSKCAVKLFKELSTGNQEQQISITLAALFATTDTDLVKL